MFSYFIFFQHQQCLALFNRIKFTRLLLTALITFTKKEVTDIQTHTIRHNHHMEYKMFISENTCMNLSYI